MAGKFDSISPEQLQSLINSSNSYKEVLEKIGLSAIGNNYKTLHKYIKLHGISTETLTKNRQKNAFGKTAFTKETFVDDLNAGRVTCKGSIILKRLIEFGIKPYACEICGISEWNGNPLTLELHHKDGNHHNNKYKNLEILCPNCHSQTSTFRFKNKGKGMKGKCKNCQKVIDINKTGLCYECHQKQRRIDMADKDVCPVCKLNKKKKKSSMCQTCYAAHRVKNSSIYKRISREALKAEIRTNSFINIAIKYGVDVKTVRRWCAFYDLPQNKKDILSYNDDSWSRA